MSISLAPLVKNIVRLSLLESVSPDLLVRFLRPFQDYLQDYDFDLDGEKGEGWVRDLFQILNTFDSTMPPSLQQALLDVAELATEEGHDQIMAAAGERQLSLFLPEQKVSAADAAFTAYLNHSDLFNGVHAHVLSKEARRYVEFLPREPRPLTQHGSEAKRVLLRKKLSQWFGQRNRTEFCDVRVSETAAEVTFLVIHGRPPQSHGVIVGPISRTRIAYIPDKLDTLVFQHETGRLLINATYELEQDFYRRVLGEVFFGDANHFQTEEVFTGQPLLDQGAIAMSAEGVVGLQSVMLRVLELRARRPPYYEVRFESHDLIPQLHKERIARELPDRDVKMMKLIMDIPGRRRPVIVSIHPPNRLVLDRRFGESVVREFLLARGFMRLPAKVQPAMAV